MKKVLCLALTLIMVLSVLSVFAVSASDIAEEPVWVVDFSKAREDELLNQNYFSGPLQSGFKFTLNDFYMEAVAPSNSYKWLLTSLHTIDPATTHYIKIRVKNVSKADAFGFWLYPNVDNDTACSHLELWPFTTEDTEWKEYIFNIDENITSGKYESVINRIRFDGFEENGCTTLIDYVAFFKTENDAKAFKIEEWEALNPPSNAYGVESDGTPLVFDLKSEEYMSRYFDANCLPSKSNTDFVYTADGLVATILPEKTNVNWTYYGMTVNIHSSLLRYVKFRIKNCSDVPAAEFWYSPKPDCGGADFKVSTQFPISTQDTEFKTYTFRITEGFGPNNMLGSQVGTIRLDMCDYKDEAGVNHRVNAGDSFTYDYVAFFASKEEADAFDIDRWRAGSYVGIPMPTQYDDTIWYRTPEGATTVAPTEPGTGDNKIATLTVVAVVSLAVCTSCVVFLAKKKKEN